jgi:hypothetical protein
VYCSLLWFKSLVKHRLLFAGSTYATPTVGCVKPKQGRRKTEKGICRLSHSAPQVFLPVVVRYCAAVLHFTVERLTDDCLCRLFLCLSKPKLLWGRKHGAWSGARLWKPKLKTIFFRTLNAKEGEEETRSYLSVLSVCQINCYFIAKNVLVNLRRLLFGVGDLLEKGLWVLLLLSLFFSLKSKKIISIFL